MRLNLQFPLRTIVSSEFYFISSLQTIIFSNLSASDQLYLLVLVLLFVFFFAMWSNCIKYLLYLFCHHIPIIWEDQDCVFVSCPIDTCCQCRCFVAQFCQFVKHIFYMFGFSVLNSILFLFLFFFLFGFFLSWSLSNFLLMFKSFLSYNLIFSLFTLSLSPPPFVVSSPFLISQPTSFSVLSFSFNWQCKVSICWWLKDCVP